MTGGHQPGGSRRSAEPEVDVLAYGDDPESRFGRGRTAQAELFGSRGRTRQSLVIVAVLALLVGAAAGAYLWNGRVVRADEDAARARVSLGATLAPAVNQTADNEFEITYTNFGQYPLVIDTVKPDELALVATAAPTGLEIAPGKTALQKISIDVDCASVGDPNQSWTPATTATIAVTTADGVARTVKVNLLAGDPRMTDLSFLTQWACGGKYLTFVDLNIYTESVEARGDTVVSHVVLSNPYNSNPYGSDGSTPTSGVSDSIVLDNLRAGEDGDAYTVSTEFPLPSVLPAGGRVDVIWTVANCDRAQQTLAEDMDLYLDGSVNGRSQPGVTVLNYPEPSLVAQLVRLTFSTCGPPGR